MAAVASAPVIETPRLRLRAVGQGDFDAYARMWAAPAVTRFIGGAPRDRANSWGKFLAMAGMWPLLGYGYWAFADRESDRLVGCGGLAWFDRGIPALEGHVEAGWAIAPDHWGRGLAGEAMAAAIAWSDRVLGAELRCIIGPDNAPSHRVAARLGFATVGTHGEGDALVDVLSRAAPGC